MILKQYLLYIYIYAIISNIYSQKRKSEKSPYSISIRLSFFRIMYALNCLRQLLDNIRGFLGVNKKTQEDARYQKRKRKSLFRRGKSGKIPAKTRCKLPPSLLLPWESPTSDHFFKLPQNHHFLPVSLLKSPISFFFYPLFLSFSKITSAFFFVIPFKKRAFSIRPCIFRVFARYNCFPK